MRSARLAWAFLTRLPGGVHPDDGESLAKSTPWFPIVGIVIGAGVGGVYVGLAEVVSRPIAALCAVGVAAIITGAFHEDGLADTFDSFGGYTRERRLEIMRDSRIGTFGTLALVVVTGLKVVAIVPLSGADGFVLFVLAHALGRVGALVTMRIGPEARGDGLAVAANESRPNGLSGVIGLAVVAGAATGGPAAAGVVAVVIAIAMAAFARHQFGGITGDVLGATEQPGR